MRKWLRLTVNAVKCFSLFLGVSFSFYNRVLVVFLKPSKLTLFVSSPNKTEL